MIAVFTGTREGTIQRHSYVGETLLALRDEHDDELTVFVGDCPTGVDRAVRATCLELGIDFAVFVACWGIFGRKAGPRRNVAMIQAANNLAAAGADVTVYYRASSERSPGTRGCVKLARTAELECVRLAGPEL